MWQFVGEKGDVTVGLPPPLAGFSGGECIVPTEQWRRHTFLLVGVRPVMDNGSVLLRPSSLVSGGRHVFLPPSLLPAGAVCPHSGAALATELG